MTLLTVEAYRAAERAAIAALPNRIVETYQPVTFRALGYPTGVDNDRDLWKFADVMQERRFDNDLQNLLGGLTEYEFGLMKRVCEASLAFSREHLAQSLVPRGALLRAINTLRHLRYIFGDRRPAVLEVGPGSGYLGALLILEGYPYIATDVAEGFYLYQSQLWSSLANGGFVELAGEDIKLSQINDLVPGTAAHVPWWMFFDLDYEKIAFGVEVVTCNHVLCEMHPRALLYLLKLAKHLNAKGGNFRFVFEGWGYDVNMPAWWVNSRFYEHGFHICHNDEAITVFAPAGATEAACHYPRTGLPNVQDATAIRRLGEIKIGGIWEPGFYATQSNPASARILAGRDEIARTVSAEQVAAFYDQLFPGWRDQYSDDRVFEVLDVPG